jgi:transposase
LIFVDESEVHLNPPLTKVWARRGEPARVPAAGDDKKRAVFGGWNYRSEQFAWRISEHKNSEAFLEFLAQLLANRPKRRRLVLVMDNAGYHRAKKVQRFLLEQQGRLEPFWLPPYSPELNLIEYAWGYLKETATNNYFFGEVSRMENAVAQACRQLNSSPDSPIQLHFKSLEDFRMAA